MSATLTTGIKQMENLNNTTENTAITIEQLAEKLGGKLWIKCEIKRIYLDRGYNTKKMSTKTYVFQREDGTFGVSCYIECPSQDFNWIKSQQQQVIDGVIEDIKQIEFEINYPDLDFEAEIEAKELRLQEERAKAKEIQNAKRDRLLTAKYLSGQKRSQDYLFNTLLEYFYACTWRSYNERNGNAIPKSETVTHLIINVIPLTFNGGWVENGEFKISLPAQLSSSSNKYNYYKIIEEGIEDLLPASFIANWKEAKEKTALYNLKLDAIIAEYLQEDTLKDAYSMDGDMYTKFNSDIRDNISNSVNGN